MRVGDFISRTFEPITSEVRLSEALVRLSTEGFLPVVSGGRFVGILTQSDALCGEGDLVGDRLRPVPHYHCDDKLSDVVEVLLSTGFPALPVFDPEETFLGVVTLKIVFRMVTDMAPSLIKVTILNVQGSDDFEAVKSTFLSNLFHHTKNPIQKILSTVSMLKEDHSERERQFFCSVIETNAKQLDLTINCLAATAFQSCDVPCVEEPV